MSKFREVWSKIRRILHDRPRYKRRHELTAANTQERSLESIISDYESRNSEAAGILSHMVDRKWKIDDIFEAKACLEDHIYSKNLSLPSEALDLLHNAIEYESLRQDYHTEQVYAHDQFDMMVSAISHVAAAQAPAYVYSDIWGKWQGDELRSSHRFAEDLLESSQSLKDVSMLTKKAKFMLMKKIDNMISSPAYSYGVRVRRICASLLQADTKTPGQAYELCDMFAAKDSMDEIPEMYACLLALPPETPSRVYDFLEKSIGFIQERPDGNGLLNVGYVRSLYNLVLKVAKVFRGDESKRGYKPGDIAGFFPTTFTSDQVETLVSRYNQHLDWLLAGNRGEIKLRTDDMKRILLPKFKDSFVDANLYVLHITKQLRDEFGDEEGDYFERLIQNLRDTENAYYMMVFAEAHYKTKAAQKKGVPETALDPSEDRIYREMVKKAFKENSRVQDERGRLVELVRNVENTRPVPQHVADYFRQRFGIVVEPSMLDIGKDNNAWYKWNESADSYMNLNAEPEGEKRVDRKFLGKVVRDLMDTGLISDPRVAVIGLACGDAWPEIVLYQELKRWRLGSKGPLNVWLRLYDINDTMVSRATYNCNSLGLNANIQRKDIREIKYRNLGSLYRQLVISLAGRTYGNLETESDNLIDSLTDICLQHYARGIKSPTVVLMEGTDKCRMDYYLDHRAENMHVIYMLRRLELERDVICYDASTTQQMMFRQLHGENGAFSTYAPIQTPNNDRVEFYFVTLRASPILKGVSYLREHQVVRCGESRIVSEALLHSFGQKGFKYKMIRKDDDEHTVMVRLIPDYDFLQFNNTRPIKLR